jgi:hypothetical protein
MDKQIIKAHNPQQSLIVSPIDRKASESLLPGERKIIEAALQPKINDQPPVDVVTTFIALITQSYTRAGYKMPDENTLALYADEFYQSLLEKYPRVTIAEIREAFKAGVYGEFGEFTGLNPKTFMQFIKGFLFSNDRKEAIRLFESRRSVLSTLRALSPEEREATNKEYCNLLFEDHKKGSLVADFIPAFIYDFLEQQGKIKLTLDEKKKINERAKSYFTRLKTSKRYKGNMRSIGDELAAYVQSRDEEVTIKNISKQFAVVDYFETQAKAGVQTIFEKCCANSCDGFKCESGNVHFIKPKLLQ